MNRKDFLIIFIVTIAVILIWVGSDIWYAQKNHQEDTEAQKLAEPINTEFDVSILNQSN